MISLFKKDNLNLSILETDFDVFADIVNSLSSDYLKKECLLDLDDENVPEYFKNKVTNVIQIDESLAGYVSFEFRNVNNITQTWITDFNILDNFKNNGFDILLLESVLYVAGEVSARNVFISVGKEEKDKIALYRNIGFYEMGIDDGNNTTLSANVPSVVARYSLNEKFRNIPKDAVDYKSLKLVKKLAQGRSGNIYLTSDGKILKMFTSNSFTYIKDKEETLKVMKDIDIEEIVKPKNLVYYDGIFVGYIMAYLPDGKPLSKCNDDSYEEKIDKIKAIEDVMKKLHENKIYICDLNPDNIFFDKDGNIKFIDCDAFVIKSNVINNDVYKKFCDPYNKIVGKNTDIYAFAITSLQLLTGIEIKNDADFAYVQKFYNKNKSKIPVSFKKYYEFIFNGSERNYLCDSYEKYVSEMYEIDNVSLAEPALSGHTNIIIISLIAVVLAIVGYVIFKFCR